MQSADKGGPVDFQLFLSKIPEYRFLLIGHLKGVRDIWGLVIKGVCT